MSNQTFDDMPLETLARQITRCATEADDRTIDAARMIHAARQRIDDGECGDISWGDWARDNIKLSESRIRELLRVGGADDPKAELEDIREQTRQRVQKHRDKKKANSVPLRNGSADGEVNTEADVLRQRLIAWAEIAPPEQIAEVLVVVDKFSDADALAEPDEATELAAA